MKSNYNRNPEYSRLHMIYMIELIKQFENICQPKVQFSLAMRSPEV